MLLIIYLTNDNMKSLMKLTSLLLIETLSHSDHIMVYASNVSCTDSVVIASSSQRVLIEKCIDAKLDVLSSNINLCAVCQEFHR